MTSPTGGVRLSGGAFTVTANARDAVAAGAALSVTVTVNGAVVPVAVGVPLSVPVVLRLSQAGRPAGAVHEYGVVPLAATRFTEYGTPTAAFGSVAVLTASGGSGPSSMSLVPENHTVWATMEPIEVAALPTTWTCADGAYTMPS